MADNKLLLKQNAEDGFFADDDPLAELARIVSFNPQAEMRPRQANLRREPEFNLEDELLREFEQYAAPDEAEILAGMRDEQRREPFDDAVTVAAREFVEPASTEEAMALTPPIELQPVRDVPELRAVPAPEFEAPAEQVRPQSHPVFDLEDEIMREFAAFDARRAVPPVVENVAAPIMPDVKSTPVDDFAPVEQLSNAPVVQAADPVEIADPGAHDLHSGYGDGDLVAEAEASSQSVSAPEESEPEVAALDAMEAEVDFGRWGQTKQSLLEDDQAAVDAVEEPIEFRVEPAADERWDDEISVESVARLENEPPAAVAGTAAESVALDDSQPIVEPEVEAVSIAAPAVVEEDLPLEEASQSVSGAEDFGLDALLEDAERYPVNLHTTSVPALAAVAPLETPVDDVLPVMQVAAPVAEAKNSTVEPVVSRKVETEAPAPAIEPFDDAAFELDLTEIELDMLEMEVETAVAPAVRHDEIVASPSVLADVAQAIIELRPPYAPDRPFVPAPRIVEDYSSLPFDPSQISGEEEQVEALAEMNIPEIAVVDHEITAPAQPDYDIDIDAEMEHIFARPVAPASRPSGSQAASKTMAVAPVATPADLDEFERALEEDFRRSLTENRATGMPDRVALTPASYHGAKRESTGNRRLLVLAASVAGLVLIGGAAVYAYWGNGVQMMATSSEPKVILADKNPVKVLPKDPGGQTVPNQDKAVYDRVSGDKTDLTKQERLVTSNEEPVDVVKKTLMPETLPMDDEDGASATDTTDPRLMADGQDKNITTTERVVSGVSPRKVRTMVVRSDGTLVPRDETAAEDTKDATPAEASQERSLDITPAATENVPDRLTANDAVAKQIEEASADTKSFVTPVATTSDVADADKPDVQPVTEPQPIVKTDDRTLSTDAADEKPAASTPLKKQDLVATPLTSTDNAAAADAKSVAQTALKDAADADVDETAPIRAVKTTKITANTPIPENRPVDQPVDIVGTVTDQGNVQKTQEVANADPVQSVNNARTTATPSGAYVIQIASLPSEAEAQNSYTKLSAKFSGVIGGRTVDIRKAAIKNKGTYYRVRIPAGTRQEATDLCARYKAAGGSCLVSK